MLRNSFIEIPVSSHDKHGRTLQNGYQTLILLIVISGLLLHHLDLFLPGRTHDLARNRLAGGDFLLGLAWLGLEKE